MTRVNFLLLLGSALFNAGGSTLMKYAFGNGGLSFAGGLVPTVLRIALNPWTVAGFASFGISFFFMAAALSGTDLTLAYPLMSGLVYIVLLLAGTFLFHEQISVLRLSGMGLILSGIVLLSLQG